MRLEEDDMLEADGRKDDMIDDVEKMSGPDGATPRLGAGGTVAVGESSKGST
jgi:hypothetical protein